MTPSPFGRGVETESVALNDHPWRRPVVQFRSPHEAHTLVHAHGDPHHVCGVQRKNGGAGTPSPTRTLIYESPTDPPSARRRRHRQQPHLRLISSDRAAIRDADDCSRRIQQDTALDSAIPLGDYPLGRALLVQGGKHVPPIGLPVLRWHECRVLCVGRQSDIPHGITVAVAGVAYSQIVSPSHGFVLAEKTT